MNSVSAAETSFRFPSTSWGTTLNAGENAQATVAKSLIRFRAPVTRLLLSRGVSAKEAEDLSEEILVILSRCLSERGDR